MRIEPRYWAAWPLLLAASIVMAQVISFRGLALWIGVSVVATWWLTATLLGAGRRWLGVVVGFGMTGLATVVMETLGGRADGPMTRSVLLACGLTVAMLLMLATRWPLLVLLPGLGLVASALALGGAGRSFDAVGVTAVAVAVSAAMLGPYRGRELRDRARLVPFSLLLGGVGFAAVLPILFVANVLGASWTPANSSPTAEAEAAPGDTSESLSTPDPAVQVPPSVDTVPADAALGVTPLSWLMWVVLVLITLALGGVAVMLLWRAWVSVLWWRERRRLRLGTPEERAVGAWSWVRMRRARVDRPLPPSLSPDVAAIWATQLGEADIRVVSSIAAQVAFNPTGVVSPAEADLAWAAAVAAGRTPSGHLRKRWVWAARRPGHIRRRLAPAPARIAA